jgi:hypothetical protein
VRKGVAPTAFAGLTPDRTLWEELLEQGHLEDERCDRRGWTPHLQPRRRRPPADGTEAKGRRLPGSHYMEATPLLVVVERRSYEVVAAAQNWLATGRGRKVVTQVVTQPRAR